MQEKNRRLPRCGKFWKKTGIVAGPVTKLSDNKYVYVRTWGDGERAFKIVSFYLMRYVSGEIDDLAAAMRIEVVRALLQLRSQMQRVDAALQQRDVEVLQQALDYLEAHGLLE